MLAALIETTNEQARPLSTCTMPNGDATICDWQGGRCTTDCHSSEQECTIVRDVAVDWAGLREATSSAAEAAPPTASLETQNRHAPEPA